MYLGSPVAPPSCWGCLSADVCHVSLPHKSSRVYIFSLDFPHKTSPHSFSLHCASLLILYSLLIPLSSQVHNLSTVSITLSFIPNTFHLSFHIPSFLPRIISVPSISHSITNNLSLATPLHSSFVTSFLVSVISTAITIPVG